MESTENISKDSSNSEEANGVKKVTVKNEQEEEKTMEVTWKPWKPAEDQDTEIYSSKEEEVDTKNEDDSIKRSVSDKKPLVAKKPSDAKKFSDIKKHSDVKTPSDKKKPSYNKKPLDVKKPSNRNKPSDAKKPTKISKTRHPLMMSTNL